MKNAIAESWTSLTPREKETIEALLPPDYDKRKNYYWHEEFGIIAFAQDILGFGRDDTDYALYPYQVRILNAIQQKRRVSTKSLRGVGKTTMAAITVLWAITCCPTAIKIICTASVWEQLTKYLFPEIRKWALRADWDKLGIKMRDGYELLAREIQLDKGQKHAFMTSPTVPERIEGAHAETVMYIFDEAKIIPDAIFDAIEGAFSSSDTNAFIAVFSTPGAPLGRFYDIHKGKAGLEHWHKESVSYEEAIEAGTIDQEHAETQKRLWGENSPLYQNHFLGEFAESSDWGMIPLSWIEDANRRWLELQHEKQNDKPKSRIWGVDPADTGMDMTAITPLIGTYFEYIKYYNEEVMETITRLQRLGVNKKTDVIAIDGLGVGAGAYQQLRKMEYKIKNVKFSGKAVDRAGKPITDSTGINTFLNIRAAAYWALREALNPSSPAFANLALPPDDRLTQDLVIQEYQESLGVIRMRLSKDKLREKIGRSPDGGDAVAIAWYHASVHLRRRKTTIYQL